MPGQLPSATSDEPWPATVGARAPGTSAIRHTGRPEGDVDALLVREFVPVLTLEQVETRRVIVPPTDER